MDELTALRLLRDDHGRRDVEPPASVTERVLAETRDRRSRLRQVTARPARGVRGVRRRRLLLVSTAAAVTLALALAGILSTGGGAPSRPRTPAVGGPAPEEMIAADPAVTLDSRSVLLAAAHRARDQLTRVPDPGGFVYVRQTGVSYYEQPEGTPRYARGEHEIWVSVDGRRPGLEFSHAQVAMDHDAPDSTLPDDVQPLGSCPGPEIADVTRSGFPGDYCDGPGYVADIPTTAAGAIAYLRQGKKWKSWTPFIDGRPGSDRQRATDVEVFQNVNQLSLRHLVPSRSLAAIYEGLAGLPGVQVVPGARTAAGRVGVSVALVDEAAKTRFELIFDPTTHQLIGNRLVALSVVAGERNRVVGASSVLETAVVKAAGLRPDGSRVTR